MTEADDIALRADKLYAARSALAETERPAARSNLIARNGPKFKTVSERVT